MREALRQIWETAQVAFCRAFHTRISRPVGAYYICFDCGRKYGVPWGKS